MTPAELRRIAENATEGPWAPWLDQDGAPHMNGLLMVGNADAVIPEGETWVEGVDVNPIAHVLTPEDREFIATFNPERVLELLDENERLTKDRKYETAQKVKLAARLAEHEQVIENMSAKTDDLLSKLAAVEKLHYEDSTYRLCRGCKKPWPCDDIKAVRGE